MADAQDVDIDLCLATMRQSTDVHHYWIDRGLGDRDFLADWGVGYDLSVPDSPHYYVTWSDLDGHLVSAEAISVTNNNERCWLGGSGEARVWGGHMADGGRVYIASSVEEALLLRLYGFTAVVLMKCRGDGLSACIDTLLDIDADEFYVMYPTNGEWPGVSANVARAISSRGRSSKVVHLPGDDIVSIIGYNNDLDGLKNAISGVQHVEMKRQMMEGFDIDAPPVFPIEDVLPGGASFIDKFYNWARPSCGAPHEFLYYGALVAIATVAHRRCMVDWGSGMPLNLFTMWIAEAGRGCKSSAIDCVTDIIENFGEKQFEVAGYAFEDSYQLPHQMTPESCLETLNERGEAAGIGYGTILWPELRTHVQMAKKDYNSGWFSLLTELYDSAPSLIRATRSYKWHIKRPTVTLVAGVQPDFMKEHITDDMIAGGFLPRFILLAPTYGQYRECYSPVPVTRDQREKTLMREGLAALRDKHTVDEKGDGFRLGIDDMAKEFLGGWAMAIRDDPAQDDEQYLGSFYSRFQDQLIKLAGLITLSRGVEVVDMKSMNIAVQLVEHQKAVAHWFLRNRGNSKFDGWLDRCRRKTLRWMDDNPGEPVVPRSAIYRSLSGQGFSAANMRTIEITLTEQGFFKEVGVKWGKPMKEEPRWKKDR